MKVIKFGAAWCAGCLIMKPIWEEIENERAWLKTEYYDYDENQEIAEQYSVDEKLPTFIFLDKNEQEIMRLQGEISKKELIKIIEEYKDK
ncbi:MAG: thioredoxin family protein [bacterium]